MWQAVWYHWHSWQLYLVVVYYANSVFVFFIFLFKGSSKCGFFHLAVLFRFYRVLLLHHVFLSEQIKMMMMMIAQLGRTNRPADVGRVQA